MLIKEVNMNNNMIKCPNCGKENKNGSYMCMFCGCSLLAQNNIPQSTVVTQPVEPPKDKTSTVLLVISTVNIFTAVPLVFYFGVLWFIFGGLSENEVKHITILCICIAYLLASVVAEFVFAINKDKNGEFLKTGIIIIVISAILGFIVPYLLFK